MRWMQVFMVVGGLFNPLIVDADAADMFTIKCDYEIMANQFDPGSAGKNDTDIFTIDTNNRRIAEFDDDDTHRVFSPDKLSEDEIFFVTEYRCMRSETTIDRSDGSYTILMKNTCENEVKFYASGECSATKTRSIPAKKF